MDIMSTINSQSSSNFDIYQGHELNSDVAEAILCNKLASFVT